MLASFILQSSVTSNKFVLELIFNGNRIEGIKAQQLSFLNQHNNFNNPATFLKKNYPVLFPTIFDSDIF